MGRPEFLLLDLDAVSYVEAHPACPWGQARVEALVRDLEMLSELPGEVLEELERRRGLLSQIMIATLPPDPINGFEPPFPEDRIH